MCKKETAKLGNLPYLAVALAAAGYCVFWLFTATPFLAVVIGVMIAASAAGIGFVAWNLRYGSWVMQRPFRSKPVRRALPAAPSRRSLEAPKVIQGVVLPRVRGAGARPDDVEVAGAHFSTVPDTALKLAPSGSDTTT